MLWLTLASRLLSFPWFLTRRDSLPLIAGWGRRALPSLAVPVSSRPAATAAGDMSRRLEDLVFDNRALKSLPIDPETQNYVRTVAGACFSRVRPTPLSHPRLVAHSQSALNLLGLSPIQVSRPEFVEYMSGNKILPGSESASHCYCGHQFGHFSGQLGDGCAHYLGEVVGAGGGRWELQLKGSGKTPYSRFADGRKVLRSSIREFLCSEAMHYLGVPTTRAGSCITSDDRVTRDILYNGNPIQERCTVITRISPTFIRFGSFEIFKTRDMETGRVGPSVGREDILHQLLDFVTQSYYPHVHSQEPENRGARTALFFRDLCVRTAHLVSAWQCLGFCHGVLNTDNMSIVGLTIDYGPYGFLDKYDPGHICNGSDNQGRYAYDQQPRVCRWNLSKLAEALSPCLSQEDSLLALQLYDSEFEKSYLKKMRLKFGLCKEEEDDCDLIESLLDTMAATGCDFTNGFQCLSRVRIHESQDCATERESDEVVEYFLEECASPQQLVSSYRPKMPPHQLQMFQELMGKAPGVLEALGLTQESLQQEIDNMEKMNKLKEMSGEEKRRQDREVWLKWLCRYSHRLSRELDSGTTLSKANEARLSTMKQNNPRFILRNHILQTAIEHAEKGDFCEVRHLLQLCERPYQYVEGGGSPEPVAETREDGGTGTPQYGREEGGTGIPQFGGEEGRRGGGGEEAVREGGGGGAVAVRSEVSRYYSKPPDWALTLCVT